MRTWHVIPGERLEVEVDPTGWPYRIQIGADVAGARPEKRRVRREVKAFAWRRVPQLGSGRHDVLVHDRAGSRKVGVVVVS